MKYIKDRSKELSTRAGIMFLLGLIGINFAPEQVEAVPQLIAGGAALLAMFIPQGK